MNAVTKKQLQTDFLNDMIVVGAGDIGKAVVDTITEWGFFDMPASTKYHGTNEGDLFRHSQAMAHTLLRITKACNIKWQNSRSPFIVGYFHDLCKCDSYRHTVLGKTLLGTELVDEKTWEYRDDQILKGHGDKSVMLASTLCQLTEEEMLCIRYHMGAYNTDDWQGFDRAIRKYQTVLWTHQADMIASKVSGV